MRLLAQVPGSVVWLSHTEGEPVVNLRREAEARGIDPGRLVFAPRVTLPEHLARHRHADVLLDTTPFNAVTTANDALWMGLPVVTCPGESMVSRASAGQLHAIGLPELATASLADYEALALRLAQNPRELATLRARLAANRTRIRSSTWPRWRRTSRIASSGPSASYEAAGVASRTASRQPM
jgi:predicted O-linked N-acetylglucosamine transferase (SPINDLY family)